MSDTKCTCKRAKNGDPLDECVACQKMFHPDCELECCHMARISTLPANVGKFGGRILHDVGCGGRN